MFAFLISNQNRKSDENNLDLEIWGLATMVTLTNTIQLLYGRQHSHHVVQGKNYLSSTLHRFQILSNVEILQRIVVEIKRNYDTVWYRCHKFCVMHRKHLHYIKYIALFSQRLSFQFMESKNILEYYFVLCLERMLVHAKHIKNKAIRQAVGFCVAVCLCVCVIACNDNFHLSSFLDKRWLWFLLHTAILMAFYHLSCVSQNDLCLSFLFGCVECRCALCCRAMCMHAKYGVGWLNCVAERAHTHSASAEGKQQKKRLKLCQRDTGI